MFVLIFYYSAKLVGNANVRFRGSYLKLFIFSTLGLIWIALLFYNGFTKSNYSCLYLFYCDIDNAFFLSPSLLLFTQSANLFDSFHYLFKDNLYFFLCYFFLSSSYVFLRWHFYLIFSTFLCFIYIDLVNLHSISSFLIRNLRYSSSYNLLICFCLSRAWLILLYISCYFSTILMLCTFG